MHDAEVSVTKNAFVLQVETQLFVSVSVYDNSLG